MTWALLYPRHNQILEVNGRQDVWRSIQDTAFHVREPGFKFLTLLPSTSSCQCAPWKAVVIVLVVGSQSPTSETWMKLQACGFTWLRPGIWGVNQWVEDLFAHLFLCVFLSLSLPLYSCLSFKQNQMTTFNKNVNGSFTVNLLCVV